MQQGRFSSLPKSYNFQFSHHCFVFFLLPRFCTSQRILLHFKLYPDGFNCGLFLQSHCDHLVQDFWYRHITSLVLIGHVSQGDLGPLSCNGDQVSVPIVLDGPKSHNTGARLLEGLYELLLLWEMLTCCSWKQKEWGGSEPLQKEIKWPPSKSSYLDVVYSELSASHC